MTISSVNRDPLAEALERLRQEVSRLGERVAALENGARMRPAALGSATAPASPPAPLPHVGGEGRSRTPASRETSADSLPSPPVLGGRGVGGEGGASSVTDELLAVIGAAVAAFLGKKAHIRQIRLVGATAWAQQGRLTIQASHALQARPARSPQ